MKRLRLLQIGDIHYPSSSSNSVLVDVKDSSFPQAVVQVSAADGMRNAFRQILNTINDEKRPIDGLLLCGDLTSYGNVGGYSDCLQYLDQVIRIRDSTRWPIHAIHVVPGNHDVNREHRDPDGNDLYRKFAPLIAEWEHFGLSVFEPKGYRTTEISSGDNVKIRLFSLNSCIGCGEKRFLPENIRQELAALIETQLQLNADHGIFPLPQEDLDTPAFKEEDITGVCEEIQRLDRNVIPLVLGHHNLLPQAVPRVSIYTELVNGGLVRSRFSNQGRPVVYCHGHIHDDPIEIVTAPGSNSVGVITISAPEIVKGFNVIEIQFGRENIPLGLVVYPYRIQRDGSIKLLAEIRVPLQLKKEDRLIGNNDKKLFQSLAAFQAFVFYRFEDLYEKIQTPARRLIGHNIQRSTLSEALLEAEWLGLIEIHHRDDELKYWQAQRIVP